MRVSKVIVLSPDVALVVVEEQEPPYERVPASDVVTTTSGVVSLVGVVTTVVSVMVGTVRSIVNDVSARADEALPAASVSVIVQLEWVPAARVLKVIVLSPTTALV